MFFKFKKNDPSNPPPLDRKHWDGIAHSHYAALVAQARLPYFYLTLGVPDTLDARFDMVILHVGLLVRRLGRCELTQALVDLLFADMDVNLRAVGVSDLSVGRKVRKMAEAFYGRLQAYGEALDQNDRQKLQAALERNLYRDAPDPSFSKPMADYVFKQADSLATQADQALRLGILSLEGP